MVQQVSPDPILVVSRQAEGRALRELVYGSGTDKLGDHVVQRRVDRSSSHTYIVTIGTIDIHGADFPAGVAWLFSGRALKVRQFEAVDVKGRHVTLEYKPVDDTKGDLLVKFCQTVEWDDTPIFEIAAPDPDEDE
jgi:hypothetical protein